MSHSAQDHDFMARALRLAARGLYTTTPNPRVGCVLVRDGRIVGEGWHEKAGQPHAEVHALAAAGELARGATAYVTLEPCSHFGRTPPCADALVKAGVNRVVAAMQDPNPEVAGKGLEKLRRAGIETSSGLLETEARELNVGFVSRMSRGRPWVRLKVAMSLDGRTALNNGISQWITGAAARRDAHAWRARACAMMTGIGTVRDDDPQLTVREVATPRQPLRVLLDGWLEVRPAAKIIAGGNALVYSSVADEARAAALREQGAEVVVLPDGTGKVDLPAMLRDLAGRGINEVMVEAGARLNGALLKAGCIDEMLIYQAPVILGDKARGMATLPELTELGGKIRLDIFETRRIGEDLRLRAFVR
ncbi:MAG: bifunctional diaminohydroxyphosphoribosylaminopyrimidine deaminase/5-amino-6-(5-phosphoribosylamino)uracil reductase RibD [Sterolibacteriaceae bacterium MAG5]|nr:bifunctional diaminohydroxyphosphoribosylaminopyrimidine deaminase/5-amino-6-(5-phosphoribosylamino)uracil reductase RibD [Candidatus Nitricoxidireducens bremensis]